MNRTLLFLAILALSWSALAQEKAPENAGVSPSTAPTQSVGFNSELAKIAGRTGDGNITSAAITGRPIGVEITTGMLQDGKVPVKVKLSNVVMACRAHFAGTFVQDETGKLHAHIPRNRDADGNPSTCGSPLVWEMTLSGNTLTAARGWTIKLN